MKKNNQKFPYLLIKNNFGKQKNLSKMQKN